ncbi:MAG: traI, partial [Phycisphaerales bacterium]|nr:traI [Phycisphaerales bacterium]
MSSSAARSYYSTADYFTEGQELQGVWRGKAADALGLSGTIEQKDWDALCENIDPTTGRQLTARHNDQRRVGWDCSFSVPKSVSLLYALSGDQRILEAFNDSVDATMADIESELQTRVRVRGQNTDRISGNGVWGRFTHLTSRPVDGVPDPQLHAHCFLFNVTKDNAEGRWKALQIGTIKRDANYFNAVMHGRLAVRLTELGVPVERTAKGWCVGGIGEETEQKFSRRTQLIDALAEKLDIIDPDEKAQLGATTRDKKNKKLSMDELRTFWAGRLTGDESDAVRQAAARIHDPRLLAADSEVAHVAIEQAANHHLERSAVVPERAVLTTAMHNALGRATPRTILGAGLSSDLIVGEQQGRRMVTSPAVLDEERRMLAFAKSGRNQCDPIVARDTIAAPDRFNAGQQRALWHLLTSKNRVMLVRGVAGAGKTTMLTEFKTQAEAAGQHLHAFAPSTDARDVLRDSGFIAADTLAMLLVNPKTQSGVKDGVILVDEAGQIGSRAMAKLFDIAQQQNARVILSGDRYQHGSVERGSALRLLEQEAGLCSAELTDIVRQRDQYRQAVADLSRGRVEAGLKTLDALKWVHEIADPAARNDRIAAEYVQANEAGRTVLVVSPTHAEKQAVTTAIRDALRHEGRIGTDAANVLKLTNRNLTKAQRRDAVNYSPGDIVVFTQNAKGHPKASRLTVGVDAIPLDLADRFAVYRTAALPVATGDRLRITAAGPTADDHRVNNGQTFTVRDVATDGTLTLNNGWRIGRSFGHIDYGYATTSHASQGKTVDSFIIAESSDIFAAAGREQLYVSVSRGRTRCSIYTDDKRG